MYTLATSEASTSPGDSVPAHKPSGFRPALTISDPKAPPKLHFLDKYLNLPTSPRGLARPLPPRLNSPSNSVPAHRPMDFKPASTIENPSQDGSSRPAGSATVGAVSESASMLTPGNFETAPGELQQQANTGQGELPGTLTNKRPSDDYVPNVGGNDEPEGSDHEGSAPGSSKDKEGTDFDPFETGSLPPGFDDDTVPIPPYSCFAASTVTSPIVR